MFKSKFKWNILANHDVNNEDKLMEILFNHRNITNEIEKKQFLSESISFHDSFLFKDMKKIMNRLHQAIEKNEKIMIYGDYDVDGVTGVAILYKAIKTIYHNVFYYIPNRFTEGYGPNLKRYQSFVEEGFTVIITVDNGITGIEEARYLKDEGVTYIITDHHEFKTEIPDAYAIVHPNLAGDSYPFKVLSGSGVSFKVAQALLGEVPYDLIDLACLGTYADIVSLLGENRSIVKAGLKQMVHTKHLGLRLLMQLTKVKIPDEFTLGFILGPRLNAPGRMDDGNLAVQLLVTEDYDEAQKLATKINRFNEERKALIDTIEKDAIECIEKEELNQFNVIVCSKPSFHEGVLGIVCNRLLDRYHKPIIILNENDGTLKGSCRTLEDFPLAENLEKCHDLLETFGGHKMAAGLKLKKENLENFRRRLHDLASENLQNALQIECKIPEGLISQALTKNMQTFRPFGKDNQNPLFLLKDFTIENCKQIGEQNKHLKLSLRKNNIFLSAIAFNMGNLFYNINNQDVVDVVGTFELNEYNNIITNQLIIKDIRCNHQQFFDYRNKDIQKEEALYLYFENNYDYQNATVYSNDVELKENIVLIDLPHDFQELSLILKNPVVKNLYFVFKCDDLFTQDHLVSRQKLGQIYQIYRRYKRFNKNNPQLLQELSKIGCNKTLQNLSLKVFFELNFVIIKGNEIVVVDNPEKKQLSESKTFQQLINQVEMKDKLILSSYKELKLYINQLLEVKNGS